MRKLLFNYSFYSHPEIGKFQGVTDRCEDHDGICCHPISDLASETHLPKPYDIVQGMEHVIGMMEETLQIYERA
jgi:hypothetical protein